MRLRANRPLVCSFIARGYGTTSRLKALNAKVLPGMPIAVDAFSYGEIPGVTAYFLTHAHSDHYTRLSPRWKHGPIYCSLTTAKLIKSMLAVNPEWVRPLPDNEPVEIPDTGGVSVTLVDAGHCPGSSLFLFTGKQTFATEGLPHAERDRQFTYLHCGDFRASPAHVLHPALKGRKIDTLYLDTTYLDPKHCFPPQAMVIDACAQLAKQYARGEPIQQTRTNSWIKPPPKFTAYSRPQSRIEPDEKTLFVVGTYTIGKERVFTAIAQALSSKIYCSPEKHAVLMCQDDPDLHAMLTQNPSEAQVHILSLPHIKFETLDEYLELHRTRYNRIVGLRPTGWTYFPLAGRSTSPTVAQVLAQTKTRNYDISDLRPQRGSNTRVTIYSVPYSEHSSFRDLTCFAMGLDWVRMVATVGSEASRTKMGVWFEAWARARKERKGVEVEYRNVEYW